MTENTVSALRPGVRRGHKRIAFYGKCRGMVVGLLSLLGQLHAVRSALPERTLRAPAECGVGIAVLTDTGPGDLPNSHTSPSPIAALGLKVLSAEDATVPTAHSGKRLARTDGTGGEAR